MHEPEHAIDIDTFWEYSDPAASEARFRAALQRAGGDERLELLTQVARTYSLRGRFDEAHAVLREVEAQLPSAGARPRLRWRLELGRTFNSSGHPERARAYFEEAWANAAGQAGLDGLAVDAAHMAAITCTGTPDAHAWHARGLRLARASTDRKARSLIPAMLNNSAWELHDAGRFAEALPVFEQALAEWTARAKPEQIRVAAWSVARCLRSLGRHADALKILRGLQAADAAAGRTEPDVAEELAENFAALAAASPPGLAGPARAGEEDA